MGERKFSESLEIKLDEYGINVTNLESILNNIKKVENETVLKNATEYYFRMIENHDNINKDHIRQIMVELKNKKDNMLDESKNENLQDKIERIQTDNDNLKNISIISTDKRDNDNTDGLKRDVTYLSFDDNGNKAIFEVENVAMVNRILTDFELLKDKNQYEIISLLSNYCKKCDVVNMKTTPSHLPYDNYKEETNKLSTSKVRETFNNNENTILKERVDFKTFVDKYKGKQDISYSLNSNGERIYIVGNETYKYVGEERELKKLEQSGEKENTNDVNISNFNREMSGKGKLEEINLDEFNNIRDYIGKEELIKYIMSAMEQNIGISEKQNDFLARFVSMCMEHHILEIPIPGESLRHLYDIFVIKFGEEKLKVMIEKENSLELKQENVKKLELKQQNKLSNWEKAGFISVTVILESALILGGIFAILALVKK